MMDCDTSKTSANEEGFVLVHYLILGASGFVMVFLSVIAGFMLRRFYKSRIIQEIQREELEIRHFPVHRRGPHLPTRL